MFGRNEDEKELNENGEDKVCVGGHHYELCVVNVVDRNKSESPESGDDTHRLHSPNINNDQTFIIQIMSKGAQRRRVSARFLEFKLRIAGISVTTSYLCILLSVRYTGRVFKVC